MKIPLYTYFRNRTLAISGFINDKTYFASLVCAFLLVGCGGSSNDNDGVVRPDSMLGVWFGNTSTVEGGQDLYAKLPQEQARQKITTETESQMCINGAKATDREPIFFYFN